MDAHWWVGGWWQLDVHVFPKMSFSSLFVTYNPPWMCVYWFCNEHCCTGAVSCGLCGIWVGAYSTASLENVDLSPPLFLSLTLSLPLSFRRLGSFSSLTLAPMATTSFVLLATGREESSAPYVSRKPPTKIESPHKNVGKLLNFLCITHHKAATCS